MPQTRTHYKNKQTVTQLIGLVKLGRYKTRNGTGSKCCTMRTWTPDMLWKLPGLFRVLYLPRRWDKHPADSIQPHQAYGNSNRLPEIFVWCRRLFAYKRGVSDVTPVSKLLLIQPWGVALTPLWLTLEQQGTGTAFCTLHTYENKHHQRAPDGMSTSSELGQLLAHLDVLPIYS